MLRDGDDSQNDHGKLEGALLKLSHHQTKLHLRPIEESCTTRTPTMLMVAVVRARGGEGLFRRTEGTSDRYIIV